MIESATQNYSGDYPHVTVVIVTHNSASVIDKCLTSLGNETWFETVVVDCGSCDATLELVSEFPQVSVLETENVGYGRGNNLGVAVSNTDLILILNPDVIIDSDRVQQLIAFYVHEGGNMMLSCKMYQVGAGGSKDYRRDSRFDESFIEEKRLCGALMLLSRSDFNSLGGFDEEIFLYFEEVDLCRRANGKGMRIVIYGEVEVEHMRAASTPDRIEYSVLRGWHDGWSKAYYLRKITNSRALGLLLVAKTILQSCIKFTSAKFRSRCKTAHREAWKLRGMIAFLRGERAFDDGDRPKYLP